MDDWNIARLSVVLTEIAWFSKHWAGSEQVFRLERTVRLLTTGKLRHEVVYGLSSLSMPQAPPPRMLHLIRARLRYRKSAPLET